MNCNIKRRIWSRELKETINAFLNRQRESRTETNRGDFNFLITGRGYHRYSFLHKSEHWLPLSTLSSPSPPLSVLLFYVLFPNLSFSFFLAYSVSFCCASHHGEGLEEATAPHLLSALLRCYRNKRMEMYVMFFCFQGEADSEQWWKENGGNKTQRKRPWRMNYILQ